MGFWGTLGKIGKIAANVVPAIFTGGASVPLTAGLTTGASTASKILSGIGKVAQIGGPLAAGVAAGQQKGREAENTAANTAANFKLNEGTQHESAVENRARLEMEQQAQAAAQQKQNYDLARRAALGMNMKDVVATGVPSDVPVIHFSGGLRPSAFGPEGTAASKTMYDKAMRGLVTGEQFSPMDAMERFSPGEYKKPGALENIAGVAGMGMGALNGYNADQENKSFQDRIAAAIEKLSQSGVPPSGNTSMKPAAPGVTPFVKPPTAQFPYDPEADQSNRG